MDNPANDKTTNIVSAALHALTGAALWIPYKINEQGIASIIYCESQDDPTIMRPYGDEEAGDEEDVTLSFFLEVDPSVEK